MVVLEIIGWLLILAGLFATVTGALGVLRFPTFFSRLHPAGLVDSFGAPLILFGLMFLDGFTIISLKLLILTILIILTSPTACHALANAVYNQSKKKD